MRNDQVTVVMYHYVRELCDTRYPEIKGLNTSQFNKQIEFLGKYYSFITMEELIDAINQKCKLPNNPVLLTFDDGYIDHYTNVCPLLLKKGIQGSFFAPVKAIRNHEILTVNKIHFILASIQEKSNIVQSIFSHLDTLRHFYQLESNEYYYNKFAVANRLDTAEVIFIKRLLQVGLEEEIRTQIVNHLFNEFVGVEERIFSRELYMDVEQLRMMNKLGMHIGSHGYDHYWLGHLSREKQMIEIQQSINFLFDIGVKSDYLTMCYPYGDYNSDTLELLNQFNFNAAFTTEVDIFNINKIEKRLTIPRLDTNDLPKEEHSLPNKWYVA